MATNKYVLPSPYKTKQNPPPAIDQTYNNFLKDFELESGANNQVFGCAIFGIGRAGTIHLTYLVTLRRVNLLYIVDDDVDKLEKIRKHYNIDTSKTKLITSKEADKVYKDPNVRYVVIASPTFTHEEVIEKSLNHKKAVFCEKPIAENIENTRKIYELAKKVGQPLLSAFNRRFDYTYQTLRNRVRAGEVGKILTVKVCSRDSPLPPLSYLKISGGIFHDCAVHDIDQILFSIGELPDTITALANSNIPEIKGIDDYDTVGILMSFPSGAIGMIDLSRQCVYGYDQRLEVFGEKGMLKAENRHPTQSLERFTHEEVSRAPIDYSFASRYAEAYKLEMDHFLDVLEGKAELLVSGANNLAVSKIATAAEESVRTGKLIKLTWSKDEQIN